MKTYKNLFDKIISLDNLYNSLYQTSKNKSNSLDCLKFMEWEYSNMTKLHFDLKNGSYTLGEYIHFTVMDPKPRNIVTLQFRDRIVQRAIYNIIQPIFEKTILPNSFACRKGKGTHRASITTQSYSRKVGNSYYLKTDFSKYFLTIDRKVLWERIERKIGCKETLKLINLFIPKYGSGINIGELLSQLFANVYGNIVDMFLKHDLKIKHFVRYMDDIVIFGSSYNYLRDIKRKLKDFIDQKLNLKFSRWHISSVERGINFVGYRIFPDFKLIRKDSVKRAKRKIKKYKNDGEYDKLERFIASWSGHLKHANTYNLRRRFSNKYEILL